MKTRLFLTATLLCCAASLHAQEDRHKKSVVKIYTATMSPYYLNPWDPGSQGSLTGSGLVIEGGRILTNAHVVSNQTYIQVQKVGDPNKYTAKVLHVAHDAELAMLTVEDPAFFKGTLPVVFGKLPSQRDKVAVYGFPTGGEDLSITEGIVSRIEVTEYTHSKRDLLTVQVDAAINPGNSGGPVFKDGALIGVSFQAYGNNQAQNIGYIIPVTLVRRFLKDAADGRYDGIPYLGVGPEKLENEALRSYCKMAPGQTGILVSDVVYGSSAWGVIHEGDVITSVDGVPVANDATVPFRNGERLFFSHLLSERQIGEQASIGLIREGRALQVRVPLKGPVWLVPKPEYDQRPTYYIFGGLVFMPLTYNLMDSWEWKDVPVNFRFLYETADPSPDRKQVILLTKVLAHDINQGYHGHRFDIIKRINGRLIVEMKDVVEAFRHPAGGRHVVDFDDIDGKNKIVLDAAAAEKAGPEILARYRIAADRSDDLK